MITITAVSYLNTLPFIYGLENFTELKGKYKLELDYPARCAEKLLNAQSDVGLIPAAVVPQLKGYKIITDYCIGAVGKVASVLLLSQVPLNEIKTITLDYQSRTSVQLVQVLAREFWKIQPQWIAAQNGFENKIQEQNAAVVIGDRALEISKNFTYVYDLAEHWQNFSSLPFVFAVWVAKNDVDKSIITILNEGLSLGVENIAAVVEKYQQNEKINLTTYYTENISYNFDDEKKKGLEKFWSYIK